jgi:hypothetical protein
MLISTKALLEAEAIVLLHLSASEVLEVVFLIWAIVFEEGHTSMLDTVLKPVHGILHQRHSAGNCIFRIRSRAYFVRVCPMAVSSDKLNSIMIARMLIPLLHGTRTAVTFRAVRSLLLSFHAPLLDAVVPSPFPTSSGSTLDSLGLRYPAPLRPVEAR